MLPDMRYAWQDDTSYAWYNVWLTRVLPAWVGLMHLVFGSCLVSKGESLDWPCKLTLSLSTSSCLSQGNLITATSTSKARHSQHFCQIAWWGWMSPSHPNITHACMHSANAKDSTTALFATRKFIAKRSILCNFINFRLDAAELSISRPSRQSLSWAC